MDSHFEIERAREKDKERGRERGRKGESSPFGFAVEAVATPREKEKSVACPVRVIKDQREDTEWKSWREGGDEGTVRVKEMETMGGV